MKSAAWSEPLRQSITKDARAHLFAGGKSLCGKWTLSKDWKPWGIVQRCKLCVSREEKAKK